MDYIKEKGIHPDYIKKMELYFEKKGLFLQSISCAVRSLVIANVSLIEKPDEMEEQTDFTVVVDLSKMLCRKFNFFGHRTDGLRIYNQPKTGDLKLFYPAFHVSFIKTISGETTRYVLITHSDFLYDSLYDNGNYEGTIYVSIYDFLRVPDLVSRARFKFDDFVHYKNTVNVYLIDEECYPDLFAYELISDEDDYDSPAPIWGDPDDIEERKSYDGIWDCNNQKLIPLGGHNLYDKANEIIEGYSE
jgi:hypothetical protein